MGRVARSLLTTRRRFFTSLAIVAVLGPRAAGAQSSARRIATIGILGDRPPFLDEAFRQGLRDLGYVEGQNVVIQSRPADWNAARLPALAAELVQSRVDVILSVNTSANAAAKQATSTIPIVFAVSGDPVAEGLVMSLARPGGNMTGLATTGPDLVGKQLEILKGIAPRVGRIGVLHNPANLGHRPAVKEVEVTSRTLGLDPQIIGVRSAADVEAAFAAMRNQRATGLLVLRDAELRSHRARITALAASHRLPAVYGLREEAEAGGLVAYGASVPHMYRRAAAYVDKILKGAKPADLPIEQPTRFELVINLKTAKALGVTIPRDVLLRADLVIE